MSIPPKKVKMNISPIPSSPNSPSRQKRMHLKRQNIRRRNRKPK